MSESKDSPTRSEPHEPYVVPGMVSSPCVGVCQLDPRTGLCLGCLRSLDEISAWSRVSPDEQRRILATVAERREAQRR